SSRRRHTRFSRDWSSDVCSSDLEIEVGELVVTHALRVRSHAGAQGYVVLGKEEPLLGRVFIQLLRLHHAGQGSRGNGRALVAFRSEERRVGKECRSWGLGAG